MTFKVFSNLSYSMILWFYHLLSFSQINLSQQHSFYSLTVPAKLVVKWTLWGSQQMILIVFCTLHCISTSLLRLTNVLLMILKFCSPCVRNETQNSQPCLTNQISWQNIEKAHQLLRKSTSAAQNEHFREIPETSASHFFPQSLLWSLPSNSTAFNYLHLSPV